MTDAPLLQVTDLAAGYGRIPVLNNISLSVSTQEIVGILGHNGVGKSTLLKTLMGFLPASNGSIVFDGQTITREQPFARNARGIGYVPQGRGIFPKLTVRDNLRFAYKSNADRSEDDAIELVLADFPRVKPLLNREGGTLSGGEQQILALARCLMSNPRFLLLDEPTEGIQPSIIDEIAEVLEILTTARKIAILLVEQNLEFLTHLSDRLLIMERGQIVREVGGKEIKDSTAIEAFMALGSA